MSKIADGLNDRPKDASIAQSGPGLPDDSSQPIEATDEEVERVRAKLQNDARDVDEAREKVKKEIDDQVELPQRGSA
ncbi:hypothetical protein [Rhizobium sp. SSA_523]|uniref:hypothetical protein n=1 Tax=Rhizobium sp. SSA_523 TaxID=2952477 RepID=UPI0020909C72|nr:hypothetical protein [Rhizobium sp. SSA_523]MCO5730555.1 hypothetical protein [Rhizobium sp. SSA_523]WKC25592.1 hypothetical protein QTJ18_16680 [Rhizobium sp. SSA_523]